MKSVLILAVLLMLPFGGAEACDQDRHNDDDDASYLHIVGPDPIIDTVICRDSVVVSNGCGNYEHEWREYETLCDIVASGFGWIGRGWHCKFCAVDRDKQPTVTICDTVYVEEPLVSVVKVGHLFEVRYRDGVRIDSNTITCTVGPSKDDSITVRLSPAQYEKLLDLLEPCRKGHDWYYFLVSSLGVPSGIQCTRCGKVK